MLSDLQEKRKGRLIKTVCIVNCYCIQMDSILEEWMPLGTTLALITKKYFGALGKSLNHLDIDRNYSVLLLLHHQNKGVSQQFIADYFLVDKTQMVRIMNYLTKHGMIIRESNPDNGREYLIHLTPKAKTMVETLQIQIHRINEKIFSGVSDKNKKNLFDILFKISNNLDSENPLTMMMNLKPVKIKK